LFEPTIDLCIKGFKVTRALAAALKSKRLLIKENKALSSIFINPETNDVYNENNLMKMPNLGMTLKIISESGSDAFYDGILTDLMVQEINENG
jgi:gamma-glutamyltranspeptidase